MANRSAEVEGSPFRRSLSGKLLLALLVLTLAMAAFLFAYVLPSTRGEFLRQCETLLQRDAEQMHELASAETKASCLVLVDVIDHTTTARAAALRDLPLAIYGSNVEQMRAVILAEDKARSQRLQRNVDHLAQEMQRRAEAQIGDHVAEARAAQQLLAEGFARDLGFTLMLLCTLTLLALLLVLGFGLYRLVVRPTRALRAATRRVAGGDLDVEVRSANADEIGDLALDFAGMVGQLRDSRAALQQLNRDLEQEVERKTRHLKDAQHQLLQAEKMASIGTLAGGIAHEFNNLIGGIRGCAAEARAEERDTERQETLDVILRAADRASSITAQLLRFARRSVEQRQDLDLAAVLHDALRLCEPQARRHRVAIERSFAAPLQLFGDADALHQVFVNLLNNAVQAMPHGGALKVAAQRDGDGVAVTVQDSGVGIEQEDLDRVFEPFFSRKAQSNDPAQGGTGLGLSVSYGIVDAHGGRMTVQSEVGKGATFTVWLPVPPS